jgi:hypothetical protein
VRRTAAAKKRKTARKKAAKAGAATGAATGGSAKPAPARAPKPARGPHPADTPERPGAFFHINLGGHKASPLGQDGDPDPSELDESETAPPQRGPGGRFQRKQGSASSGPSGFGAVKDAAARVLSELEAQTFESTLCEVLFKAWELMDMGLTATSFSGEECTIWRQIDDDDTAFLVRRLLKLARKNPILAGQIRVLVEHWDDYRVVAILGPRVVATAGWYPAQGMDLRRWGFPVAFPAGGPRRARPSHAATSHGSQGSQGYEPGMNGYSAAATGEVLYGHN